MNFLKCSFLNRHNKRLSRQRVFESGLWCEMKWGVSLKKKSLNEKSLVKEDDESRFSCHKFCNSVFDTRLSCWPTHSVSCHTWKSSWKDADEYPTVTVDYFPSLFPQILVTLQTFLSCITFCTTSCPFFREDFFSLSFLDNFSCISDSISNSILHSTLHSETWFDSAFHSNELHPLFLSVCLPCNVFIFSLKVSRSHSSNCTTRVIFFKNATSTRHLREKVIVFVNPCLNISVYLMIEHPRQVM